MKSLLAVLLSISILLLPFPAQADEQIDMLKDAVDALKHHRKVTYENYEKFVQGNVKNMIGQSYLVRYTDLFKTYEYTVERISVEAFRVQQLRAKQAELVSDLASLDPNKFDSLVEFEANAASFRSIRDRAQTIQQDLKDLKSLWADACGKNGIDKRAEYFMPSKLFHPDKLEVVQGGKPYINVGGSVSFNTNGDFTGASVDAEWGSEEENVVRTTMWAAAIQLGPATAGWSIIVAAAIEVIYAGIQLGKYWGKKREIVDLQSEQEKIIIEIQDYKLRIAKQEDEKIDKTIKDICQEYFPEDGLNPVNVDHGTRLLTEVNDVIKQAEADREAIRERYKDFIEYLRGEYLVSVEENFVENVMKTFEDEGALLAEMQAEMAARFVPHLKVVEESPKDSRLKHLLWDDLLVGDAFYAPKSISKDSQSFDPWQAYRNAISRRAF